MKSENTNNKYNTKNTNLKLQIGKCKSDKYRLNNNNQENKSGKVNSENINRKINNGNRNRTHTTRIIQIEKYQSENTLEQYKSENARGK